MNRKRPRKLITQDELKAQLSYNPETGLFRWKINKGKGIGCVAGSLGADGYSRIQINRKLYLSHHLAWVYIYGRFPAIQIDHVSGDKGDNRIDNLRDVPQVENARNKKLPNTNKSGVIGVSWDSRIMKWYAQIKVNGKSIYLGVHTNKEDAIKARGKAEIKYGFHENHGRSKEKFKVGESNDSPK